LAPVFVQHSGQQDVVRKLVRQRYVFDDDDGCGQVIQVSANLIRGFKQRSVVAAVPLTVRESLGCSDDAGATSSVMHRNLCYEGAFPGGSTRNEVNGRLSRLCRQGQAGGIDKP
jgi:hypothetical protein